jgi:hypothetical protein
MKNILYNDETIYSSDVLSPIDSYSLYFNVPPLIKEENLICTAITGLENFSVPIGFNMVEVIEDIIGKKVYNVSQIIKLKSIKLPTGTVEVSLNGTKLFSSKLFVTCNYVKNTGRSKDDDMNCGQVIQLTDFKFYC